GIGNHFFFRNNRNTSFKIDSFGSIKWKKLNRRIFGIFVQGIEIIAERKAEKNHNWLYKQQIYKSYRILFYQRQVNSKQEFMILKTIFEFQVNISCATVPEIHFQKLRMLIFQADSKSVILIENSRGVAEIILIGSKSIRLVRYCARLDFIMHLESRIVQKKTEIR